VTLLFDFSLRLGNVSLSTTTLCIFFKRKFHQQPVFCEFEFCEQ